MKLVNYIPEACTFRENKSLFRSFSLQFLKGSEQLSEKAMAPHSSTLARKIPWTEEPGRLQSMGLLRVRHDWATSLSLFTFLHWRRKWQPTPVFLPGESQGRGSLVGCRLWGCTVGHDWSDFAAAAANISILYLICQQIWKTQQWPQDWKWSVLILISKKGNAKVCSNYRAIALISHASMVMLKILQARL